MTELTAYDISSKQFVKAWTDGEVAAKRAQESITDMLKALEDTQFTRTAAINRIVEDHKQLKGFSRMTIYRALPAAEKRLYLTTPKPERRKKLNVSNDTNYTSDTDVKGESVQPPQPPASPHDDAPTEEPEEGATTQWQKQAQWIRFEMPVFASRGILNAWYDAGGIIYQKIVDNNTVDVESAAVHLKKQKALEVKA